MILAFRLIVLRIDRELKSATNADGCIDTDETQSAGSN